MNTKLLMRMSFVLFVVITTACGIKTAPEAPEDRAPKAVAAFALKGLSSGIMLSWQAPEQNSKGDDILALDGFSIMRREYELARSNDFEVIANITPHDKSKSYSYLDSKAISGKTYDYIVVALNDEGTSGIQESVGRVVFHGEDSKVSITPYILEVE